MRGKRNAEHNFGHPWLMYIDRIQTKVQQIFNLIVYPRHYNLSHFKPLDSFVSVGVGPLCFSQHYIDIGEPDQQLKGDIKFIANKMNVRFPPMPVSTKEEKKIFNDFFRANTRQSSLQWRELVCSYRRLSDGSNIFPKLPSLLKNYYTTWKQNQKIRLFQTSLGKSYNDLLMSLVSNKILMSTERNPSRSET